MTTLYIHSLLLRAAFKNTAAPGTAPYGFPTVIAIPATTKAFIPTTLRRLSGPDALPERLDRLIRKGNHKDRHQYILLNILYLPFTQGLGYQSPTRAYS